MSVIYDCGSLLSSFDQFGRDRDLIVAGGQLVMCIVRFDDGVVQRVHHFRVTRKLDHSVAQLSWNHCLHDDVIGMASPNGKLFELKVSQDGQVLRRPLVDPEHQQGAHCALNKRQISRVRFHPTDQSLFSSSHDGQVRGFDLRNSNLVTRLPFHKPADNTSLPKCYDFQFDRTTGNHIYAIYDNGSVVVWDWRYHQQPYDTCLLAPGQPLFSLDLHPTRKRFAAVSSRGQLIHLYSFETHETTLLRVPNDTGRLEWRPNRSDQFVTCSVTPDQLVYVWDARRPYVPFATFDGHHKLIDVQWRRGDEHTLIAADNYEPTADEKHGYLIWHRFPSTDSSHTNSSTSLSYSAHVTRPAENFRSAVLALSNDEIITVQSNNREHISQTAWRNSSFQSPPTPTPLSRSTARFGVAKASNQMADFIVGGGTSLSKPMELFLNPTSIIKRFSCPEVASSINAVKTMAREYRVTGAPVAQLCAHNAAVAAKCQRQDIARAWELIGATMGSICPTQISAVPTGPRVQSDRSETPEPQQTTSRKMSCGKHDKPVLMKSNNPSIQGPVASNGFVRSLSQTGEQESGFTPGFYGGGTTTDSDAEGIGAFDLDALIAVSDGAGGLEQILPEDDSQMIIPVELGPSSQQLNRRLMKNFQSDFTTNGSASIIEERRRSFDNKTSFKSIMSTSSSASSMVTKNAKSTVRLEDYVLSLAPDTEMGIFAIRAFEWSHVIVDLIESIANANDAQNACAMLIVASPLLSAGSQMSIPQETQRFWFQEYVALLSRLRLAYPLGKLLNHVANSNSPALQLLSAVAQELSLVETTYTPLCHACGDYALTITSGNTGPTCKRCKRLPAICTVCSRPVRGLYVWCRVCLHGGHLVHFRDWFTETKQLSSFKAKCPSGACEHVCDLESRS